ncbi:MAG: hypothetical protein VCF24_02895 [Candidatus Latescibacterota bacterium]
MPLSSAILRVPANGEGIVIPADEEALRASGYKFADGFRNAFDMGFAPNGDMFAGDNGPDSDLPDALMWVREGHHFGFPWRMGGIDNPQTFAEYDPSVDNYILFTRSSARNDGLFHNDPGYPPPPMIFSDPVINLGPDADRLRDPATGEAIDASDAGLTVKTFTPHSSPLGIVFDEDFAMAGEFNGAGFVLRTGGDCCNLIGSFNDPDEDLLHLDLEKVGDNYQARITRIVGGFQGPMDAEVIGNRIYVIERSLPASDVGDHDAARSADGGGRNGRWRVAAGECPRPELPESVQRRDGDHLSGKREWPCRPGGVRPGRPEDPHSVLGSARNRRACRALEWPGRRRHRGGKRGVSLPSRDPRIQGSSSADAAEVIR